MENLISSLYPSEGGPCLGFACRCIIHWKPENGERNKNKFPRECGQLFRTEQNAWLHVALAHGILREPNLPVDTSPW